MALTKAEAAKLTQDLLLRGVIETIIVEAPILNLLPFRQVTGTAVTYNREATIPTAEFYDVGDAWTEATPTFTQVATALKIMGKDADVDQFLQSSYANPNDLEAEVIASSAKATAQLFSATFITGDSAVNAKAFDGIAKLIAGAPGTQTVTNGANGAAVTLDQMDVLIDAVKPGRPDVLLMSKRERRSLSKLRRTSGNLLEVDRDQFGLRALFYDGIPLVIDENIPVNVTTGTSTDTASIYALKLGAEGVLGFENGQGIQVDEVGPLETKDAERSRIKWYATIGLMAPLGVARMTGVRAA